MPLYYYLVVPNKREDCIEEVVDIWACAFRAEIDLRWWAPEAFGDFIKSSKARSAYSSSYLSYRLALLSPRRSDLELISPCISEKLSPIVEVLRPPPISGESICLCSLSKS